MIATERPGPAGLLVCGSILAVDWDITIPAAISRVTDAMALAGQVTADGHRIVR